MRHERRGQQRAADQPGVITSRSVGLGDHARLDAMQHAAHASHGLAQRGLERHAARLEIGESPGAAPPLVAALAHVDLGALQVLRRRLPQGVGDRSDFRRRGQRPGEFELRAQRVSRLLRAAARRAAADCNSRGDTGLHA